MTLAERIRSRLDALGLKPAVVAREAGLGIDYVRDILRGSKKSVSAEHAVTLALILQCNLDWLITGRGAGPEILTSRAIPIVTWVSAGAMAREEGQQDIIGEIELSGLDPDGRWIALRVEGDSMDRISPPGSLIFVDLADRRLVPNACYIIVNGDNEASYKRFRSSPARFEPVSTNPAHEAIFPDGEPSVIGRVRRSQIEM